MRRCLITFVALAVLGKLGDARGADGPPFQFVGPPVPARVELERGETLAILAQWGDQCARLKTIEASFQRWDKEPKWNRVSEYRGKIYLEGPEKICLQIQAPKPGPMTVPPVFLDYERIVSTGKELMLHDYARKQIYRTDLTADEKRAVIPRILPIALILNFDANYAKEYFDIRQVSQNQTAYLLVFVPKSRQKSSAFSKAYVQLNKNTFLVNRVLFISPDGKDSQDYTLSGYQKNGAIESRLFQAIALDGWKVWDFPAWYWQYF